MKLKGILLAIFSLLTVALAGCGGGADGLNGSLTVTAAATGVRITGTAVYTNPQQSNLIGQEIQLSYIIGNTEYSLGTVQTNNSGAVQFSFTPAAFAGSRTVTVKARADKLEAYSDVSVSGLTASITPPPAVSKTVVDIKDPTLTQTVTIPSTANFITVSDPFSPGASHNFLVSATVTPSSSGATIVFPSTTKNFTIISASGSADLPDAVVSLPPPALDNSTVLTVTWTVTEVDNNGVAVAGGFRNTATTTVTLTNDDSTTITTAAL